MGRVVAEVAAADQADGQLTIDGAAVRRTGPGAPCSWCRKPIPGEGENGRPVRRDAKTCSKECRQARYRLRKRLGNANDDPDAIARAFDGEASPTPARATRRRAPAPGPITVAYADPPYIGLAARYYGRDDDPYEGAVEEVDHVELVADLETRFRDGWALSCSMASLDVIVPLLPTGEWHLCPWVKQNNPPADTYGLHTCWEALIVVRGRQAKPGRRDWLLAQPARGGGHTLMGRKPIAFVAFLFQALGLVNEAGVRVNREDQLHDLFPGTGIVGNAWADLARDPTADASFVDRQGVAA